MFLRQTNQVGRNTLSLALPIRSELSLAWHAVHLDIAKFCVKSLSNIIFLGQDCPWPVCCLAAPSDASIAALAFAFFLNLVTSHLSRVALSQEVSAYILWLFQIFSFPVVSDYCQVCRELKNKEGLNIAFASFSILHRVAQTRTNTGQHNQFQGDFWHA